MKMPSAETGQNRKLSQLWYGLYQVIAFDETNVTVEKVYPTQDNSIYIH